MFDGTGGRNPFANGSARFRVGVSGDCSPRHRRKVETQVEAIEQRAGRAPLVARGNAVGTAALASPWDPASPQGHGFIAPTSMARDGEGDRARGSGDVHDALFERLPQRFEHAPAELGQLVEKQDAAMRQAQLARPGIRCRRRRARCPSRCDAARGKGGCAIKPAPGAQTPGNRVNRRDRQRLVEVDSGGSSPGRRRASIVLPAPGGPLNSR